MLATTTVGPGPIRIAPRPVPQGCEHVWATGIGTAMQEMTKIAAPISATSVV